MTWAPTGIQEAVQHVSEHRPVTIADNPEVGVATVLQQRVRHGKC